MKFLIVKLSPIEGLNSSMIRTLSLTKGLISLGHNIDFLTIPISDTHVKASGYTFLDKINIIRTSANTNYDSVISKRKKGRIAKLSVGMLRKIYHKLSLYNYTYSIAKRVNISLLKNDHYDVIISVSDPKTSHIAIQRLIAQGLKYGKWIQYWGDPMTYDITNKSVYPSWFIAKKELALLDEADKIVYVSPFTLNKQKKTFPNIANKMHFLPVPYLEKKYYPRSQNKKFVIGYYGAYSSRVRNIMPLYNSCLELGGQIHLDIIGDSDITLTETNNVNIQPRGNVSSYEEKVDLLVCMLNSRGTQIPGKVYHYAATNKPILVILDGDQKEEMKEYLESFNRYYMCENNVNSISNKIKEIMSSNKEFMPCKEFEPKYIAQKFIDLI
ncbi:glycosyltransferase family protein [Lederbergia lenta]|uniref:Uncharacterized protein n=1 Tax=Lederbergia lenta TaxID=1467 RepID=A0A2X4WWF7_LEDLE|nr:hypothetical protein [Lederbergia lenta]MEC2323152.1 hypothetical protein [Lederbergia lenta]SQI62822.1 Uncharacterised protein [Lederbergia lenta]